MWQKEKLKLVYYKVENIVVKKEKTGYQHFSLSPTVFPKAIFDRVVSSLDYVVKPLTLYLMCQFWGLPIQQQIKIWCQKYGQIRIQLSDWVRNIVGKGEIARYEWFLLFLKCFQNLSSVDASKWVSMEWRFSWFVWSVSSQHKNLSIFVCLISSIIQDIEFCLMRWIEKSFVWWDG